MKKLFIILILQNEMIPIVFILLFLLINYLMRLPIKARVLVPKMFLIFLFLFGLKKNVLNSFHCAVVRLAVYQHLIHLFFDWC